jgi:hypothetical protein
LCIRKRETVSCLQYVYVLDYVYQKEGNCIIPTVYLCSTVCLSGRGNCIIPTICLCFRLCVSEREKSVSYPLYVYVLDFVYWKERKLSYLQYIYVLDYVYRKEANCIMTTICSLPRFCVSEKGRQYHTYNMIMI